MDNFISVVQKDNLTVNKWTRELIQTDSHQATNTKDLFVCFIRALRCNTKGKDRQIQLIKQLQMKRWQAELATLSQKGGNSVTQT